MSCEGSEFFDRGTEKGQLQKGTGGPLMSRLKKMKPNQTDIIITI